MGQPFRPGLQACLRKAAIIEDLGRSEGLPHIAPDSRPLMKWLVDKVPGAMDGWLGTLESHDSLYAQSADGIQCSGGR